MPQDNPFALPHLAARDRYRSSGICRPRFALDFLLLIGLSFLIGMLVSFISLGMLSGATKGGDAERQFGSSMIGLLLSIAGILFPAIVAIPLILKSQLRSWPVLLLACFAWSGAYVLGLFSLKLTTIWDKALDGDPASFFLLLAACVMLPTYAMTLFQVCCSEAYRVFYPEHGEWGKQHFAFFKAGSARKVAELLELGDLNGLVKLRVDGPNAGAPAWQAFTSLILTLPEGGKPGTAYLHAKSVIFGGGPLFTTRIHSCLGLASLRHIALEPGEVERIKWLFPELGGGKSAVPQVDGAKLATMGTRFLGIDHPVEGERLETPNGSFIERLAPAERRYLRARFWFGFTLMFQMLVLAALVLTIGQALDSMGLLSDTVSTIGVVIGVPWVLLTMGVGIFFSRMARLAVMRGVRSRPGKRFVPDRNTVTLNVEESCTFSKTKLLADDYGLAHGSPAGLDVELSNYRIHLDPRDAGLDYHVVSGGTGLRIFCNFGEHQWSISVSNPTEAMGLAVYGNPKKRAERLWKHLYQQIAGQATPSPKAPPPAGPEAGSRSSLDI